MRLLPTIILVTLIPLAGSLAFTILETNILVDRLNQTIKDELINKTELVSNNFDRHLTQTKRLAQSLSDVAEIKQSVQFMDSDDLYQRSQLFIEMGFEYITFVNSQGVVIARSTDEYKFGDSLLSSPQIKIGLKGHFITLIGHLDGQYLAMSIKPINNYFGEILGLVIVAYQLNSQALNDMGTQYSVGVGLTKANGEYFSSFKGQDVSNWDSTEIQYQYVDQQGKSFHVPLSIQIVENNILRKQAFSDLREKTIFFLFVLSLAMIILVVLIVKRIVAPLNRLISEMYAFSKGSKHELALDHINNEIGDANRAFLSMRKDNIQLLEELQRATIEAKTANKAKSAFLASMSHEIRTPLNAILGYTQLLQQSSEIKQSQQTFLQTINQAGRHLLELINEILDLSKIESGLMFLQNQPFSLNELIQEIDEMFELACKQKKLNFINKAKDIENTYIEGDLVKLKQVIINLLGNAIKFTEKGNVTLIVKKVGYNSFYFEVNDSGEGILCSEIKSIFMPFTQAEQGKKKGGTGLGLSISERYVALMGGELKVESISKQGARFFFTIPFEVTSKDKVSKTISKIQYDFSGLNLSALIVNDYSDNQELLNLFLEQAHFKVRLAHNGQEAIDIYANYKPDIIFMDIAMPILNGRDTWNIIRNNNPKLTTKCIAVTASVFDRDRKAEFDACFDDFIVKQFTIDELFQSITSVLRIKPQMVKLSEQPMSTESEHIIDYNKIIFSAGFLPQLNNAIETSDIKTIEQLLEKLSSEGDEQAIFSSHLGQFLKRYDFDSMIDLLKDVVNASN